MNTAEPLHRPIAQDAFLSTLASDRRFEGLLLSADLVLDQLDLTECRFERCLFRIPTIRSADFSGAEFNDCRFEPTRFANCKARKTRFVGCTLFDASSKNGCTFAFCDLQAAEIIRSNFSGSAFEGCDLYGVNAKDSSFRGARLPRSTFTKVISRRSTLSKASFDTCNFSFADLSDLNLQSCEFMSCKMSEVSLIDSDLSHAVMLRCTLDRAEWERARLHKADLRGSNLSGLNLAVLADYAGLRISESEQAELLRHLGVDVDSSGRD
ncbi:MAG: pentapeptide repeat-containing protein [Reyranellaceae bacterium]